jgi:protein Mpv17
MSAPAALSTWRAALAALKRPAYAAAARYDAAARRRPVLTGVATTLFKTSAADLFAQTVVEGREQVDWSRHSVFCAFGFFYLGGFQYFLYNKLFVAWCAPITRTFGHRGAAPVKTFIDQAIQLSVCFVAFAFAFVFVRGVHVRASSFCSLCWCRGR